MDSALTKHILITIGILAVVVFMYTLFLYFKSGRNLLTESTNHVVETTSTYSTVEYQPYDDTYLSGTDVKYLIEKYGADTTSVDSVSDGFYVIINPSTQRCYKNPGGVKVDSNAYFNYISIGKHEDTSLKKFSSTDDKFKMTYIDPQAKYHSYVLVRSEEPHIPRVINGHTYDLPAGCNIGSCKNNASEVCGIWLIEQ